MSSFHSVWPRIPPKRLFHGISPIPLEKFTCLQFENIFKKGLWTWSLKKVEILPNSLKIDSFRAFQGSDFTSEFKLSLLT